MRRAAKGEGFGGEARELSTGNEGTRPFAEDVNWPAGLPIQHTNEIDDADVSTSGFLARRLIRLAWASRFGSTCSIGSAPSPP